MLKHLPNAVTFARILAIAPLAVLPQWRTDVRAIAWVLRERPARGRR